MKQMQKVHFRQYFLNISGIVFGPYSQMEIMYYFYQKKLSKAIYAFKRGMKDWEFIGEFDEFDEREHYVPPPPPKEASMELINNLTQAEEKWLVFAHGHLLGPFSTLQVRQLIQSRKIRRSSDIWCKGMSDWKKLMDMPEFFEYCYPKMPKIIPKPDSGYTHYSDTLPMQSLRYVPQKLLKVYALLRKWFLKR